MASVNKPLTAGRSGPLHGSVKIPCGALDGHLALALAAVSVGRSIISGIDERADIRATVAALRVLGCRIESGEDGSWYVDGVGLGGLAEPDRVLDAGQAGLGIPLLIALCAMQPMTTVFGGADSLSGRSWHWLTAALERSGAGFLGRTGSRLPLTIHGSTNCLPTEFEATSGVARAALLLAALNCPGETVVRHRFPDEDGADTIFAAFGARLVLDQAPREGAQTRIEGQTELWPAKLTLVGDTVTAVLIAAAAISRPGSEVVLERVMIDDRLAQAIVWFEAIGADVRVVGADATDDRIMADLHVRGGALSGAIVRPDETTVTIDDYPLLAVLAARAAGRSVLAGWERRPDWLAPLAQGLRNCGVDARVEAMSLIVHGNGGGPVAGGCRIEAPLDHRVAVAFLVLGLSADAPIILDPGTAVLDHYPSVVTLLTRLGGSPTVTDPQDATDHD